MAKVSPKVLLVEGSEEVRVIPELLEANGVNWGSKSSPAVLLKPYNGYDNLVDPDVISTELQASGLTALGILVDADNEPLNRWNSIKNACQKSITSLPEHLSDTGLIHVTQSGVKFGIWMMPDNQNRGMLETFLAYLIPTTSETLWQFTKSAVNDAKAHGAAFSDFQVDKANIYTWLAWQNPPGRQLHQALMQRILNPKHSKSKEFVRWFKTLYDL